MSKTRFAGTRLGAMRAYRLFPEVKDVVVPLHREYTKHHKANDVPNAVENIERLLLMKRELCCVSGCNRKHIMWTPKGKFCGKHREEAIAAMKQAKVERYGA